MILHDELARLDKAALIERCIRERNEATGLRAAARLALLALRQGDHEAAERHLSLAAEPSYAYPTEAEGAAAARQLGMAL